MRVSDNFVQHYSLHIIELFNKSTREGENSFSWKETKALHLKRLNELLIIGTPYSGKH